MESVSLDSETPNMMALQSFESLELLAKQKCVTSQETWIVQKH